ncbi:hypothetical protein BH09PSE6_BH09PSE6_03820 [soil metagenome]
MDKAEKLLLGIDLTTSRGAEIGALDKPTIPPSTPGVCYFDYLSYEELRAKYPDDPNVTIDNIVKVTHVWKGEPLADVVGPDLRFDYIVASHVVEHAPDLVGWLLDLASVLKPRGQIRLAVPDMRYCFDMLREPSQVADVLVAHIAKAKAPQPRSVLDFALHVTEVDCASIWKGAVDRSKLPRLITSSHALDLGRSAMFDGAYHDVHCWTFTPLSFARLMKDLVTYGVLPLKCAGYFDTAHYHLEFFVSLEPCDDASEVVESWAAMERDLLQMALPPVEPRKEVEVVVATQPDDDEAVRLRKALDSAARQHAETRRQLDEAHTRVSALLDSTSWRITAPLRSLKTALNGLRRS